MIRKLVVTVMIWGMSHSAVLTAEPQIATAGDPETEPCAEQNNCQKPPTPQSSIKTQSNPDHTGPVPTGGATPKATPQDLNTKSQPANSEKESENTIQQDEKRLKVLFVDVNTVMERVGHSMDWTANWIDGYFAKGQEGKDKAKAWGHIIMGWEPRDGEWGNFPVKFKVQAKLPNLQNKVELILSDNEQDDFKNLPYESVRPEAYKSSQRSLGAAVRFLHATTENIKTSSRLGWGDNQVYARSQLIYRQKYFSDKLTLNLQPALEYYASDGWGARFLVDTGYTINPYHELRYNYSIRDLESYDLPEWRTGLYSISAVSNKSAVIVGASAVGVVEPEHTAEFYKFSIRYRRKAIRSWIFIEVEPFVEFSRERLIEGEVTLDEYSSFVRDVGITFRLEAHYGFL